MIRICATRDPVTVPLRPPYSDVTVTLKRLTTADYGEARQAAHAILRNDATLIGLLAKHDLLPEGGVKAWKRMKDEDVLAYAAFLSGIGVWLGAVECAIRGVQTWTGILDSKGKLAAVDRENLETLMLDEALSAVLMDELDKAARILFVEGER